MDMKFVQQLIFLCVFLLPFTAYAQNHSSTQTIRGVIVDKLSGVPLPYVTVGVLNLPQKGTVTDEEGKFILSDIPVGRHDIQASSIGYETAVFREIMLTSAKEIFLEIQLRENITELGEVVVTNQVNKEQPLNSMALSGARMLSVEEARRYAGGMDDPARLASSFA